MQFNDLLEHVKVLDEKEKLELVQMLIEDLRLKGSVYEIWAPFGHQAAERLTQLALESSRPEAL